MLKYIISLYALFIIIIYTSFYNTEPFNTILCNNVEMDIQCFH